MTFYGIYKVTNKVNGKMYIGQHITDDLDDGYLGSGTIIRRAVEKYGEECFTKEWLEFTDNKADLDYLERMYVDEEWLARPDTYNLKLGGMGGTARGENAPWYGKKMSIELRQKMSEAHKGQKPWCAGKKMSLWIRRKLSEAHKGKKRTEEAKAKTSMSLKGHRNWSKKGWRHSEETKKKLREIAKMRFEQRRLNND